MMTETDDDPMTIQEAAKWLRIGQSSYHRMAKEGWLPKPFKVGSKLNRVTKRQINEHRETIQKQRKTVAA
jgi:excisionase family DNA binding protein